MSKKNIAPDFYQSLITAVNATLTSGLIQAQKALERQRLKTYWTIGRDIIRYVNASNGALAFSDKLYERISRDVHKQLGLDLTADTVSRTVQLHRNYPKFPRKTSLTFSHYLVLMRVKDTKLRLQMETKASKESLSVLQLKDVVTRLNTKRLTAQGKGKELKVSRGEPYLYAAKEMTTITGQRTLNVDCGFKIDVPLNGHVFGEAVTSISRETRIMRVIKDDEKYRVTIYHGEGAKHYTYAASVSRVIDGDTFDVHIDVGFGIGLSGRMRFKGINVPEINEPLGKPAKLFLEEYFAQCPIIIIRSYRKGMYGRWLADVFALKGSSDPHLIAAQGEYLNQRLVDEGLAEKR